MKYLEFHHYLQIIKDAQKKIDKLTTLLHVEYIDMFDQLVASNVELLESAMNDTDGWISFWCFECDFGRDAADRVTVDEQKIDIGTTEKLYAFIKEQSHEL